MRLPAQPNGRARNVPQFTSLNKVVARIGDDQWSMEMPASFQTQRSDRRPTLRQIINYHAYDDAWVPDMLAGRTMDEAGKDNHKGDLLGDDPKARFAEIVEKACAAARNFDALDRVVRLQQPAEIVALGAIERGFRLRAQGQARGDCSMRERGGRMRRGGNRSRLGRRSRP